MREVILSKLWSFRVLLPFLSTGVLVQVCYAQFGIDNGNGLRIGFPELRTRESDRSANQPGEERSIDAFPGLFENSFSNRSALEPVPHQVPNPTSSTPFVPVEIDTKTLSRRISLPNLEAENFYGKVMERFFGQEKSIEEYGRIQQRLNDLEAKIPRGSRFKLSEELLSLIHI